MQSTLFSTLGMKYSQLCGQLRGYQYGSTDAFSPLHFTSSLNIDNAYADGVSITYGSAPRKYIWTYASEYIWTYAKIHDIVQ